MYECPYCIKGWEKKNPYIYGPCSHCTDGYITEDQYQDYIAEVEDATEGRR